MGLGFACEHADDGAAPLDAGPDVGIAMGPKDAGAQQDREVHDAGDPPRPDGLPDAWQIDRRLDRNCGIYASATRDAYPPRLAWEPCDPAIAPGTVCKRLSRAPGEKYPPSFASAWVDSKGHVFVAGWRDAGMTSGSYWFVADVDGDVQTALFHQECVVDTSVVNSGRYAVRVWTNRDETSGFYAGEIGEAIPRLAVRTKSRAFNIIPGSVGLFYESTAFQIVEYSWEDGGVVGPFWSPAEDNGLQQGDFAHAPEAMFWTADNLDYSKIHVYTRAGGIKDFLTAGLVIERGYADLGTDGKDMAWMYGHDRTSGFTTPYDHYDMMTAPYTTDPTKVVPRRLRSEDGPAFGLANFTVGCGYAARSNGRHLRIVRLSDGQSWVLNPPGFHIAFALTCDELFTDVNADGRSTLAGIRLDSLGPGLPPD